MKVLRQPSVWETREREGQLATETPTWRGIRHEAEDPDTTAARLQQLTDAVIATWQANPNAKPSAAKQQGHLVIEAIAAHPNTSPLTLIELLSLDVAFNPTAPLSSPNQLWEWLHFFYGFTAHYSCGLRRNPNLPLLCLETPDFWERVRGDGLRYFLREAALPHAVVRQIAQRKAVAQLAGLHIALAGEVQNQAEARTVFAATWGNPQSHRVDTPFVTEPKDCAAMNIGLNGAGQSPDCRDRLVAALAMPLDTSVALDPFSRDLWGRSPLQLLEHLTHDGNRLVRWVAQMRLRDPHFVFRWSEEE